MSPSIQPASAVDAVVERPQGCTNLKLRQLMRRVSQRYDTEVGQVGLKGTQYSLLSYVVKLGPIRPVDLAAGMNIDASTLSRNLKPLVAAGWITLEAGADARSRLVQATEAGRAKRVEAQRRWRVAQEGINATLGPARVIALHALIDEAMSALDASETTAGHGQPRPGEA
jgi:DNA-binding MarR family transcriptional regulator